MASENVLAFTDSNFQSEVVQSPQPVLVDFWAPWCGPCRAIAPMIDELAKENLGSVKVGKVNIDDSPGVAQEYGIQSIPTLMFFKDGQVVQKIVGGQPKARLQSTLDSLK